MAVASLINARPAPAWHDEVRQEQVASIYRNLMVGMMSTWLAAGVLALLLDHEGAIPRPTLITFFILISLLTMARVVLAAIYKRTPNARRDWRKWGWWFTAGCIASGIAWGIGSIFLMAPGRFDLQLLVVVLLSALVYGALASFGRWTPAFYGFFLPAMVPSAVWAFFQGDVLHLSYGVLAALWIPSIAWLAIRFSAGAVEALNLGFENAALAEDLRRQKELADTANAAKSRFLAAASHDLRQPVHALGLFVGALKNEKLAPSALRLVEQIDAATESLDELFTALLDVSRLDAGVVRPRLRPVPVRALLDRLVREMRPSAEAKGLDLRLRMNGDVWVLSDAMMLERILRNLISNAVRHTERGGVLVGARVSAGSASLEIWDTGPGIPEHMRELIFREFYQVEGPRSGGGLGLGLAIVRRLCVLLQHPLELHSRTGRGSVFRVRAPRAAAQPAPPPEPPVQSALTPGARVWVIDDDAGVRAGMEALLTAWGHDVHAAASGEAMLAAYDADPRPPHVIVCDYGLGDEDGLAVIATLRRRVGAAVPAALITGDTAPDRLREAIASGLPILHKPVSKARLRALIGNLARAGLEKT